MKRLALAAVILSLTACGKIDTAINSFESATGMLDRTVTLYAADGKVIKSWETTNSIDYVGPVAGFIDNKGNNVRVSGTFIVESK